MECPEHLRNRQTRQPLSYENADPGYRNLVDIRLDYRRLINARVVEGEEDMRDQGRAHAEAEVQEVPVHHPIIEGPVIEVPPPAQEHARGNIVPNEEALDRLRNNVVNVFVRNMNYGIINADPHRAADPGAPAAQRPPQQLIIVRGLNNREYDGPNR